MARKVVESTEFLKSRGVGFKLVQLSEAPRTAKDVERLYGCPLCQVLKTILFIGESGPVLAVLPGDRRASLEKLGKTAGQKIERIARPDEVLQITGHSVGGVTPLGVDGVPKVIDEKVFENEKASIGSGVAEIGIEMKTTELRKIWDGKIADVSQ